MDDFTTTTLAFVAGVIWMFVVEYVSYKMYWDDSNWQKWALWATVPGGMLLMMVLT